MFGRFVFRGAALALVALTLTTASAGAVAVPLNTTNTTRLAKIMIPGSALRSFDISWVDAPSAHLYLADRSNKSLDVIDTLTNTVTAQIGGFVGFTGNNDTSGPDGVVVTFSRREAWVGDGDSTVKVVDLTKNAIAAAISTGGKGRADELAYDPKDNLILIANDADDPPFLSFISVGSRQVLKKIEFPTATDGLEQPIYDPATAMFYQAVPATSDQPGGQIAVIDPVAMTVVKNYNLNTCNPHGIALGPGNQLLAGCNRSLRSTIIDKTTGTVMADFTNVGGSDEVWYNPGDNHYYLAQTVPQNLGVIDALTFGVQNVQSGIGAHSVAADQALNHIFVPIAGPDPACPSGCIAVYGATQGDQQGASRNL